MPDKGIPSWPKVTIRLIDDRNAEVKIAGRSHQIHQLDPRQAAISLVAERATQLGRPIKATATERDGRSWPLIIHPDGRVDAADTSEPTIATRGRSKWRLIGAAALAVVLVGGTLFYLLVLRDTGGNGQTAGPAATLPTLPAPKIGPDDFAARPAPPGWSTHASWAVDLAENTDPAVSTDGKQVAIINRDKRLSVFDSTGRLLWQDEVPQDSSSPYYATIDGARVVAVSSPETLKYWPVAGSAATQIMLPDSAKVQFFGTAPLVMEDNGTASLVSGDHLQAVNDKPRLTTPLLADNGRALLARYGGPLFWSQTGKQLVQVDPKPPAGAKGINHIVLASPGLAVVHWNTNSAKHVIPTVNSTANGAVVATCPTVEAAKITGWKWVPDQAGKVAAYGECLISLTDHKTFALAGFQPLSVARTTIYGRVASGGLVQVVPGRPPVNIPENTARPWGVAGERAIVVHESVVYALDKAK